MPTSPERLLLSSVLRQGDFKVALAHGVTTEMFHEYDKEWVWLDDYFRRFKKVPSKATFVGKFPDFRVAVADDTVYLTEEVKRNHVKNVLIDQLQEITESISDGDVDSAVRSMNAAIVQVSGSIGAMGDTDIFTDFRDVLTEVESRYERAQKSGSAGIPFGFPTLDKVTGGAQPGEFWIVAARLGQGKSWLMQYMAAQATGKGYSAVFNALEQTRAQVAARIHALLSPQYGGGKIFDSNSLMRGKDFEPKEYRKFLRALHDNVTGSLHVSDASRGRVSPMTVAGQIERHSPDVVYIDYLTLMQKSGPDWQGVAQLSGDIKVLGSSYGIPMICAAQLNREHGLGREPAGPEALAQSDSIGQDADGVLTFKQLSKHVIAGRVAKYRNGEGDGRFWIEFRPGEGVIREVSYNRSQDIIDEDKDDAAADEDRMSA
jgi:replicative DNA helicase